MLSIDDKFTIKCNSCGSNDISITEEFDYDYDDNIVGTGDYYLICNNCGQTSEYY